MAKANKTVDTKENITGQDNQALGSEVTESKTEAVKQAPLIAKDIDLRQTVTIRNGFQGLLLYKDKRTGMDYRWEEFGDEQDIELGDLRNARGNAKKFFENNWFLFDEDWIPEYLGMSKYYKNALKIEDFDTIFDQPADEIEKILSGLSKGQRKSVAYRARQLIADGTIDSRKVVNALEKCLGVELVEK